MSSSEGSAVKFRILASDNVTILSIVMSTSRLANALAALVFTGASAESLPRAITAFILGGAVVGLIFGLKSRFNTLIAGTQDSVADGLIAVTASVAASATNDPATATVVLMDISCAITGTGEQQQAASSEGSRGPMPTSSRGGSDKRSVYCR